MFSHEKLAEIIESYKQDFPAAWKSEQDKWRAVQHFQLHWDINAANFAEMFEEAVDVKLTSGILDSNHNYPRGMMVEFVRVDPEAVRNMFRRLFDEELDLTERIGAFKASSEELRVKYKGRLEEGRWRNHFQRESAITTYLWLKYPDRYYIYKYTYVRELAHILENDYVPKKGGAHNVEDSKCFYDEVRSELLQNQALRQMLQDAIKGTPENSCWPDEQLVTMTIDLGHYVSTSYAHQLDPELLSTPVDAHYWLYAPGENAKYWDEFREEGIVAIGWDSIDDLSEYDNREEMIQRLQETLDPARTYRNDSLATWQFANEMHPGDIVYARKGKYKILGRGIVTSEYEYDEERDYYRNIHKVQWTNQGVWSYSGTAPFKTLTDITSLKDKVEALEAMIAKGSQTQEQELTEDDAPKPYSAEEFLSEVYMDRAEYNKLTSLLHRKRNIILQGPPGVGKTFAARRLAYSIIGVEDPERVRMIQFHQSYSYEDFIEGYRPTEAGTFQLHHGAFYEFCRQAREDDSNNEYFFIIDEINRGNLSKIFGELFMLIENDKRDQNLQLLYSGEAFSVPSNVYIIGLMNTADRSLAMLDYALRRRFAFYTMHSAFKAEKFVDYQTQLQSPTLDKLILQVEALNKYIKDDPTLGAGFCIGHSYFCGLKNPTVEDLSAIVEYELIPLLEEYWFDNADQLETWTGNLRSALK